MKVTKEIVKKIKRLRKIEEEADTIRYELDDIFKNYIDADYIDGYYIADTPIGEAQREGEYCQQWSGYSEDRGNGIYYYPIEDSKKFVAITYEFKLKGECYEI